MVSENNMAVEPNFEALAKAIVSEAADEYKRNRYILDTIDRRKYKDSEIKETARRRAQSEIKDVERFFKSEWFYTLSGLNGDKAFDALKETYINEYIPMREELAKKKGAI